VALVGSPLLPLHRIYIIGVTPTGRATVAALRLNRPGLVNMRQVLYGIGKHPPDLPET